MTGEDPQRVVEEQKGTPSLWAQHPGVSEGERVLRSELRRLHRAVEEWHKKKKHKQSTRRRGGRE